MIAPTGDIRKGRCFHTPAYPRTVDNPKHAGGTGNDAVTRSLA